MSAPITSIERYGGCPDSVQLARFAAGMLDEAASRRLMRHITDCPECGSNLRTIVASDDDDLTLDELAAIDNLPSARPTGRATLARRMAAQRRLFAPWMRIAAVIAGVGIALGGFWYARQRTNTAPDALVARAYTAHRPFAYRLSSGGTPVPLTVTRSSLDITSLPPEVLTALNTADAAALKRPNDPQVLNAKGQAWLIALHLDTAQKALERAHQLQPTDDLTAVDLATALALRAESSDAGHALLQRSLQLLDETLQRRPADTVARFNRALILKRLGRDSEAAKEFQILAREDTDAAWREEAARQLQSLKK
jgi:tetratricopeptide (TPR) repeat protein